MGFRGEGNHVRIPPSLWTSILLARNDGWLRIVTKKFQSDTKLRFSEKILHLDAIPQILAKDVQFPFKLQE